MTYRTRHITRRRPLQADHGFMGSVPPKIGLFYQGSLQHHSQRLEIYRRTHNLTTHIRERHTILVMQTFHNLVLDPTQIVILSTNSKILSFSRDNRVTLPDNKANVEILVQNINQYG